MLPEVLQLIYHIAQVFEQLGVAYYVGGSIASGKHGYPRLTRDVDFVADLKGKHIDPLVAALEAEFYIDGATVLQAVRTRESFNLIHFDSTLSKLGRSG